MSITQGAAVTELRYKDLRFLITDSPDDENIQAFTEVEIRGEKKPEENEIVFLGLCEKWCHSRCSSIGENLRYQTT